MPLIKEVVIIGNGDFPKKEFPRQLVRQADMIVCCDGGTEAFLRNRGKIFGEGTLREPDVIIGDMDSLSGRLKARYSEKIVSVSEQETNDQSKAFHYVMQNVSDVAAIHILAATGKHEDHTVGNMSLLMEYARECGACGCPAEGLPYVDMVSDYSIIFALTDSCELHVGQGRKVSIFSPDNSLKITSKGLQWQTSGVIFDNWWKATLNRATQDIISLTFSHPSSALIILD